MDQTLSCVVKPDVDTDDYEDLFNYVCGHDGSACDGINRNYTSNAPYGAYGMCNSTQQLNWVLNQYAGSQKSNTDACDFSGSATSQQAAATPSGCAGLLQQAGSAGTGSVTSSPTSGGGSGAAATTSKGAASAMVSAPSFNFGLINLGVYFTCAILSGAAMILL